MNQGLHGTRKRGRLKRLIHHLFPERQIFLRTLGRVSHIRLSAHIQIAGVGLLILGGCWAAFSTASYVLHDEVLSTKDNQIANVRLAYRSLLGEVAEYQKKFTNMSSDLEDYHGMMLSLAEQNTALQQNLNSVEHQLKTTEKERMRVIAARESLKRQLGEIHNDIEQLANRNFTLKDNLTSAETELESVVAERNQVLFEEARMRRQIVELEERLARLQEAQKDTVQRLTERTLASVDEFEKVVKLAGIDPQLLINADKSLSQDQGGPFISLGDNAPDGLPGEGLKASLSSLDIHLQQLEGLQTVLRKLPLTAPMDFYRITSRYGKRRDPFNRKWGMHYGVDFGDVYKSPIYATAPGIVTYVGWKGNYGRMVEISHGAGIKTRFGHLYKALVKKGQKVKFRDKIGMLGNSGRSTGSHLHYEVLFNGRPRDPMKFIEAGRHVFQG